MLFVCVIIRKLHLLSCVGMTAEEFISRPKVSVSGEGGSSRYGPSRYQLFQETVASWLDIPVDNVDVFTVLNHPFDERTIDVRYSAHGSPYYRPTKLNGIMARFKSRVSYSMTVFVLIIIKYIRLCFLCGCGLWSRSLYAFISFVHIAVEGTHYVHLLSHVACVHPPKITQNRIR